MVNGVIAIISFNGLISFFEKHAQGPLAVWCFIKRFFPLGDITPIFALATLQASVNRSHAMMAGKRGFSNASGAVFQQWPCHGFENYLFTIYSNIYLTTDVI
jgi:hypothetical protein